MITKSIENCNKVSFLLDLPIKELQDIPVYIFDEEKFKEVYEYGGKYQMTNNFIKGALVFDSSPDEYPSPFIMIKNVRSVAYQLFLFFHEYGHYLCRKEKCECLRRVYLSYLKILSEVHAWDKSFDLMVKYKCYQSILYAFEILDKYDTNRWRNDSYKCGEIYDKITDHLLFDDDPDTPYFRAKKWVKNCPEKYKNSLIENK